MAEGGVPTGLYVKCTLQNGVGWVLRGKMARVGSLEEGVSVKVGATPRHARGWYRMHRRNLLLVFECLDESLVIVYSSLFVTPLVCRHTLVTMVTPHKVWRRLLSRQNPFSNLKSGDSLQLSLSLSLGSSLFHLHNATRAIEWGINKYTFKGSWKIFLYIGLL